MSPAASHHPICCHPGLSRLRLSPGPSPWPPSGLPATTLLPLYPVSTQKPDVEPVRPRDTPRLDLSTDFLLLFGQTLNSDPTRHPQLHPFPLLAPFAHLHCPPWYLVTKPRRAPPQGLGTCCTFGLACSCPVLPVPRSFSPVGSRSDASSLEGPSPGAAPPPGCP